MKKTELQRTRETAKVIFEERSKFRRALFEISQMGKGVPLANLDWVAIGKNAVYKAESALLDKCTKCGQHMPLRTAK